jgi:MOSC domain-containing protein YiiM
VEHYAFWNTVRRQARAASSEADLPPGSLGENLTLSGLLETQVWQGDVLRFADCELIVSQVRRPCPKFNAVMGFNQAAKLMAQSGYCGFYLAVTRPGNLSPGEPFELLPGPRELRISDWFRSLKKPS